MEMSETDLILVICYFLDIQCWVSSTGGLIVDVASQENGNKIIAGKNSAVTSSFLQCDSSGAWCLISVVEGGWEGRDHQGMSRPVTPSYNELQ